MDSDSFSKNPASSENARPRAADKDARKTKGTFSAASIIPNRASGDEETSHESLEHLQWLSEQKPPHW